MAYHVHYTSTVLVQDVTTKKEMFVLLLLLLLLLLLCVLLSYFYCTIDCIYHSVPGKCPWVLQHNSRFWPVWALTWDIISIHLYGSCYLYPLKFGTWVLTWEWALAWDTTVIGKNGEHPGTVMIFMKKVVLHLSRTILS